MTMEQPQTIKYCPSCKHSTDMIASVNPAMDFLCTKCVQAYTNKELDDAFLAARDTAAANEFKKSHVVLEQAKQELDPTKGAKFDTDKPRMELLDSYALTEIAKVMTFGAKKYASHNWRKGIEWGRLIGAAQRHIAAFNDGEDLDPESDLSHLAHAGCCIMFLLWHTQKKTELDDRYKEV